MNSGANPATTSGEVTTQPQVGSTAVPTAQAAKSPPSRKWNAVRRQTPPPLAHPSKTEGENHMKTEETPNPADDSTQAAQGAKADKAGAAPATASSAPMKDMEVKEGRTDPAEEATATAVDAAAADLPSGSPRGRSTKRRKRQRHRRQKSQRQ
jgi:hypothetical protein